MAVFPILKTEPKVQTNDKIRLWADETFLTPDSGAVTAVEIEPHTGDGFIAVFDVDQSQWFLDWAFATAGTKTATLRVTSTGAIVTTVTKTIEVVTPATDNLFSTDDELKTREHDIVRWVPDGFSSWNHVHRQAQMNILDWLDEIRLFKNDMSRWTAADLVQNEQFRRISIYTTLRMIFSSLSNQVGDVFDLKSKYYLGLEKESKNRNYVSLDLNGDGEISDGERADLRTFGLVRR